jgi:hypothetical protein
VNANTKSQKDIDSTSFCKIVYIWHSYFNLYYCVSIKKSYWYATLAKIWWVHCEYSLVHTHSKGHKELHCNMNVGCANQQLRGQ